MCTVSVRTVEEISLALHLSKRTVERDLANAYRKLNEDGQLHRLAALLAARRPAYRSPAFDLVEE